MEREYLQLKELERRAKGLNKMDPKRWAFESAKSASAIWLHSPPDAYGYIPNECYTTIWASYLGVPDPVMAPYRDFYFGKEGLQVDEFGNNLASASLPGRGFRVLHNDLQLLVSNMMELGGIQTNRESTNFLSNKMGGKYIDRYNHHLSEAPNGDPRRAKHCMIPDIMAHNYPAGRTRGDDSGARPNRLPAIFELKTFYFGTTRFGHNTNASYSPTDRRANGVRREYSNKFDTLDRTFAYDFPNIGQPGVRGPFDRAQDRFFRGGIIPLVAGPNGQLNEDFSKSIATWAGHAAASETGRAISPLDNTHRKGGAFPILLQQFRRAIAVTIVRGMAEHKLRRIHYLRPSREAARHVAQSNHSDNKYKPSEGGRASWYNRNTHQGYGGFRQFLNGHYYTVP